jgi:preprotein translocase subunit SecA
MSHALTNYNALYESMRARRRKAELSKGLDGLVARAQVRTRTRKISRRWLRAEAEAIDALAPTYRNHSEAALDDVVRDVREVFVRGRQDDEAVRRAVAMVREVARRETGEEAFIVQLMGALALYHGRIIEMVTGEGKTLTGSIAAPLLAWRHRYLHVFTVNDYLARRDARSRECIYKRCALTVGAIQQEQEPIERVGIYARSIVYGTPKQMTADWLRDQLRIGQTGSTWSTRQRLVQLGALRGWSGADGESRFVQEPGRAAPDGAADADGWAAFGPLIPGLRAALVDEADAVLIDEGVVPLIIARARREDDMAEVYRQASSIASRLDEGPDYSVDHLRRKAELKARGRHRCEQMFDEIEGAIWRATRRAEELVRQALIARHCYIGGRQYHVVDGQVVIVDEYTGRFLPDRSWEHGLHQAVEAKEGLDVTADRETLARLSFQRFFRSYPVLSGMTGTAADAIAEMEHVYARPVTVIPTNRPMIREKWPLRVFRTAERKWSAIVDSIEEVHGKGRPILVGTRSIEASEFLAERLRSRGLEHQVLNALHDAEEADLIAFAGRRSKITVATNMAGRGTDIILDDETREAGGLHVILTEMHTAKRIDRQFMGRAGRQGDPGSSQTFVSLEDELVRLYAPRLTDSVRAHIRGEEATGDRFARVLFRVAQRRAEARARRNRSSVLRQDDWIDKHLPGM